VKKNKEKEKKNMNVVDREKAKKETLKSIKKLIRGLPSNSSYSLDISWEGEGKKNLKIVLSMQGKEVTLVYPESRIDKSNIIDDAKCFIK
jgi:hypothetical protein